MPPEVFAAADVADAGTTIIELRRQLAEAYRREEAIAQVLRAITQSSDELQPVLNVIAEDRCSGFVVPIPPMSSPLNVASAVWLPRTERIVSSWATLLITQLNRGRRVRPSVEQF